MLSLGKVKLIERLLILGITQRQISLRLKVSRGTILAINKGRLKPREREEDRIGYSDDFIQIVKRCSGCGAKVWLPCLKCQLEEI